MTLAEIVADIERQARNYGTVILPTDDAMRLRAVARAAVEWAMADDEYDAVPPSSRDTDAFESNLFRRQAARRALLHAAAGAREGEGR